VTEEHPTWIVLFRDVSEQVRVQGQRSSALAMVLDATTGLVVSSDFGTSRQSVVDRALRDAVIRPAAPLPKVVPERIVCPPELIDVVEAAAAKLSKLVDTSLVEGVEMWDAEEIVDSLVGHLEGRAQPIDPPDVADWRMLFEALEPFVAAAPWQRWSDDDLFAMRLEFAGRAVERTGIVLGAAGVQHGFNVTADPDALQRAATGADDPRDAFEGALIVHLNPWREVGGVFADKARRYGWPAHASLVPQMYTVRDGEPADLSVEDARLLGLAVSAVVARAGKRLVAVDTAAPTGELTFGDGSVGRYEVLRP
jgi:hypothetical protein